MKEQNKVSGTMHCDVLIVGGGMAGLMTAYELKKANISCIVCEADTAGSGVTKNTTGKVTAQHGLCYGSLLTHLGRDKAKAYLNANLEAVERFGQVCRETDSLFEVKNNYVYSQRNEKELCDEQDALKALGYGVQIKRSLSLPLKTFGAVEFKNQGQTDACQLTENLASQLKIYEHTPVRRISGGRAYTDTSVIVADKIIIATHFPVINKYGMYFMKMYQERSYFIAAEECSDVDGMYIGTAGGPSFRNMGELLYIGGGSHRTGKDGSAWQTAENTLKSCYPEGKVKFKWATQDCITLDGMPYIGQYSPFTPNLFVATGFNKWGMTGSMLSAMILSAAVQGKEYRYADLFDPHRSMLHKRIVSNAAETISGLVSFKTKRCPHLGCALEWNKNEKTWDCPCHGSRFSEDGRLINEPAQKRANIK